MSDPVLIRPALERDYPAIARIQYHCPETAQWPLGDYAGYPLLLALIGGEPGALGGEPGGIGSQPAGFCSWRQSAPGEAEILNIAVDPAFRRRGVASALLTALCQQAEGTIFLEVAEPNAPAIALYRKHGWEYAGLRTGYYDHGLVNAVVMKKRSW